MFDISIILIVLISIIVLVVGDSADARYAE